MPIISQCLGSGVAIVRGEARVCKNVLVTGIVCAVQLWGCCVKRIAQLTETKFLFGSGQSLA